MAMNLENKRIIISKTNQIGDVLFALPIASAIKKIAPRAKVIFLARQYTRALIEQYQDVDEFADWELMIAKGETNAVNELKKLNADIIIHVYPQKIIAKCAKKAKIKVRIGTNRRHFHWFYCNKFITLARKHTSLHESELDMKFCSVLGDNHQYTKQDIIDLLKFKPFDKSFPSFKLLSPNKFNLILHPKTRGQHIEWPPKHFAALISMLDPEKYSIFITGIKAEGDAIRDVIIEPYPHVVDLTQNMGLEELIHFIAHCDGMICASTGPVHIAAALGLQTLGLYAPIKPFDATRWGPIGSQAEVLSLKESCDLCRTGQKCLCVAEIRPQQVYHIIEEWYRKCKIEHGV